MESSHCGAVGIVNREIVDSHRVINSVGHHGVQYALAGKEHNIGHHPIAGSRQVVEMRSSDYSDTIHERRPKLLFGQMEQIAHRM